MVTDYPRLKPWKAWWQTMTWMWTWLVVEGTVERMASQWVEAAASQEAAWVVILELVVHLPAARQVVLSAATM